MIPRFKLKALYQKSSVKIFIPQWDICATTDLQYILLMVHLRALYIVGNKHIEICDLVLVHIFEYYGNTF